MRLLALLIAALSFLAITPASAQYRFDPRIDPDQCHWQDVCDYGGRAIRAKRIVHRHYVQHRRYIVRERCDCRPVRRTILRVRG